MATIEGVPAWHAYGVEVDPIHQIPLLRRADPPSIPLLSTAFDKRNRVTAASDSLLHFCVKDTKLRPLLRKPQAKVEDFARFWGITSPDFSVRSGAPRDVRLLSVRANRMVGAYFQARGLRVIPHVRWCDSRDYDFCFLGVENGAIVFVSNHGLWRKPAFRASFTHGLHELIERINPPALLVHGTIADPIFESVARKTHLVHFLSDRTIANRRAA